MDIKIKVPSGLKDIKLSQYLEFIKLKEVDESAVRLKMIEIFCNLPENVVRNIKYNDVLSVSNHLNNLFDIKPTLINTFKLNGVKYGFVPSLEDLTFGEYVDLDTFISDEENLHKAMNVLYRPIKLEMKGKYLIEDYEPKNNEIAKDFTLDVVFGAVVFFYDLGKELSIAMTNYLQDKRVQELAEKNPFQKDGDGITQFTNSLKETLQSLNILQN